ncbi:MAG: purine-nucleoside phosphorylase [Thermoanaerobaculia bacterium]|nr:purine-nucleoside phosphorylase [Thermoanaerobaculia bacterium]
MLEKIEQSVEFIRERCGQPPQIGIILGSGLGDVVDSLEIDEEIPYAEIPNAPSSGVAGHKGRAVIARHEGVSLVVLQGRVHYYEGWDMDDVVFLARVLGRLGISEAIVTNAAGGINVDFHPGDLMLISDHINLFGANPLRGPNLDPLGARFPDMTESYPERLRLIAKEVAAEKGLEVREGVYVGVQGPSYETPAEIRAFRTLGGDAVGMSTVPEVIALGHMAIPVLGVSCITNMAAGILPRKLTHDEVIETTARVKDDFATLLKGVLSRMAKE